MNEALRGFRSANGVPLSSTDPRVQAGKLSPYTLSIPPDSLPRTL